MVEYINTDHSMLPPTKGSACIHICSPMERSTRIAYYYERGIHIVHDTLGQPHIISPDNYYISITHTKTCEAHIIATMPCGIDIECNMRSIDPVLRQHIPPISAPLLHYWLQIEAYAKLTQQPLRYVLKHSIPPTCATWTMRHPLYTMCIVALSCIEHFYITGDIADWQLARSDLIVPHI